MKAVYKKAMPYLTVFTPLSLAVLTILLIFPVARKDLPPYLFALGAFISFGLTIIWAFQRRRVGTPAMVLLFVLCGAFAYLPEMDSISAGWVSFKLNKTVDRAEELLDRLKKLASINATVTYSLISWVNRWNGMPLKEKQEISDQIDAQLRSYDLTESEIDSIKMQYVSLIGLDLSTYFELTLG